MSEGNKEETQNKVQETCLNCGLVLVCTLGLRVLSSSSFCTHQPAFENLSPKEPILNGLCALLLIGSRIIIFMFCSKLTLDALEMLHEI